MFRTSCQTIVIVLNYSQQIEKNLRTNWLKTFFFWIQNLIYLICMYNSYGIFLLTKMNGSICQNIKVLSKLLCLSPASLLKFALS